MALLPFLYRQNRVTLFRSLGPLLTAIGLLALWQLVTMLQVYPSFIIPPPIDVLRTFIKVTENGKLWEHTAVTLEEVLLGLALGLSMGMLLGYAIARFPVLEDILSPIIVAFQSTPIVAYAPLLIIWFGTGTTSKIITCAVVVFFPTLMNTVVGIRNVPSNLHDLMRSLQATDRQILVKLEIPSALPIILTGLKTSATLAVIGAVVGEFVGSSKGLGALVTLARNQYDTPLVLVAVITMTIIALSLYSMVSFLEWRLLQWQRHAGV